MALVVAVPWTAFSIIACWVAAFAGGGSWPGCREFTEQPLARMTSNMDIKCIFFIRYSFSLLRESS
jgi:hypothetical protein